MERNANPNLVFRLKVEETVNPALNSSELNWALQYKNTSGEKIYNHEGEYLIKINGSTVINKTIKQNFLDFSGEYTDCISNWLKDKVTYQHNSSGNGSFSISVQLKADSILSYYRTVGSAEISENYTSVDTSLPTVSNFKISADRYGLNARVSFDFAHSTYKVNEVRFVLKNLTLAQVQKRNKYALHYALDTATNDYSLVFEKYPMSLSGSVAFNLDADTPSEAPLKSGGSYNYKLTVTAQNGKSVIKTGTLKVPQKVTGVTCDSNINIMQGETAQLNYSVVPANAQLQTVTFTSSDTTVATVDSNGIITAKEITEAFKTAVITVKTTDGGYTAKCTVNVTTSAAFPHFSVVKEYLTAADFQKLIFAAAVIRGELIDAGATVAAFETITVPGRNMPIVSIMPAFVSLEANCRKLKTAAESLGVTTKGLPSSVQKINKQNTDWLTVVNNWIVFLNSLHSSLGGG